MNYLASFDIDSTLVQSSAGHEESLIFAITARRLVALYRQFVVDVD